jgi:hypothetical protein
VFPCRWRCARRGTARPGRVRPLPCQLGWSSQMACGYSMAVQASPAMAMSAFSPRTRTDLPWILVWPNCAPCWPARRPVSASIRRRRRPGHPPPGAAAPGPGASPAAPGRPSRPAGRCLRRSSAGATQRGRGADPAEQHAMAPCRSRPISSIESAPAVMPATRHPIFRWALTPHSPPGRTCSASSSGRAARSTRAITGTRPPCDTRFGSSNTALVRAGIWDTSHVRGVLSAWAMGA